MVILIENALIAVKLVYELELWKAYVAYSRVKRRKEAVRSCE